MSLSVRFFAFGAFFQLAVNRAAVAAALSHSLSNAKDMSPARSLSSATLARPLARWPPATRVLGQTLKVKTTCMSGFYFSICLKDTHSFLIFITPNTYINLNGGGGKYKTMF